MSTTTLFPLAGKTALVTGGSTSEHVYEELQRQASLLSFIGCFRGAGFASNEE